MKLRCLFFGHNWSENKNGMRICLNCGKFQRYFSISGMLREIDNEEKDKRWLIKELSDSEEKVKKEFGVKE